MKLAKLIIYMEKKNKKQEQYKIINDKNFMKNLENQLKTLTFSVNKIMSFTERFSFEILYFFFFYKINLFINFLALSDFFKLNEMIE